MSITYPGGFRAAGVPAGLKSTGKPDVALAVNDGPLHNAAAVFTSNRVVAAPVLWSRQVIADGRVDAVVLNAPWLEFQLGAARAAITPVVELQARLRPMEAAPQVDLGFYTRAQREVADPDDPVEVNPLWRPEQAMTVHAAWLRAVLAGHAAVSRGLNIEAPICVLLSARSALPTRWSDELTSADSVLVVDDIARAALKLGRSVTVERIDGALHDVFLSRPDARADAYARLDRWVRGWAHADAALRRASTSADTPARRHPRRPVAARLPALRTR